MKYGHILLPASQQFRLHYLYNANPYIYICGCGGVALQKVFQQFILTLVQLVVVLQPKCGCFRLACYALCVQQSISNLDNFAVPFHFRIPLIYWCGLSVCPMHVQLHVLYIYTQLPHIHTCKHVSNLKYFDGFPYADGNKYFIYRKRSESVGIENTIHQYHMKAQMVHTMKNRKLRMD